MRYKSSHPIAITHCPYVRFKLNDKGIKYFVVKPPSVINHKNILKKNYIPLLSVLIDRSVVKELYFENIRPEDYKLWINLIYKYKHESISVDKILAFYRISNQQRSKNKFNSLVRIFKFYNKLPNQNLLKSLFKTFNWGFFNFLQRITFYGKIDPKKITYLLGLLN